MSFLAKVLQSWQNKIFRKEKIAFSRAIIFYKNVCSNVILANRDGF